MNILITICARGGSKGIPGKNIKMLCGKPLIAYTIDVAKQFSNKYTNTVVVLSTDDDEIKLVAKKYGLTSDYKRPDYLAGDSVGKVDAIADVLFFTEKHLSMSFDYILDMDVTSPLRNMLDLENALKIITADKEALNLFSVTPSNRSPYFNMVELKENGYYGKVKSVGDILTRQSAPKVYDLNASFYFYHRKFFDLGYKNAITDLSLIYEVPHICFDLDHPIDFEIMSYLLLNKKLDFEL